MTVNNCPPPGLPCSPILPFLVDPHLRTPYSQSWSAGIQVEPYPSLLLEAMLADGPLFGHSTTETFRPDFTTGARQIQLGMKLSF